MKILYGCCRYFFWGGIWIFKWNRTHIRYILHTKLDLVRQFSLKQSTKNSVHFSLSLVITQWKNKITTERMNEWMNEQENKRSKRILCSTFLIYSEWILLTFIFVITQNFLWLYVCASTNAATAFLLLFCSFLFLTNNNNNKKIRRWTRNTSPCSFFSFSAQHRHRYCPKYQSMCL